MSLPFRLMFRGGKTWLHTPQGLSAVPVARPNRVLIAGLKKAQKIVRSVNISPCQKPHQLLLARGVDDPHERKLAELAFLAPDIQQAILAGRPPAGLTLRQMLAESVPLDWHKQRVLWGFEDSTARLSPSAIETGQPQWDDRRSS